MTPSMKNLEYQQHLIEQGKDPVQMEIDKLYKVSVRGPGNGMKSHLMVTTGDPVGMDFNWKPGQYEQVFGHD